MNSRFPTSKAPSWRDRFLEIARQVEGDLARPVGVPSGLRPRSRMAGFATLRRARRSASAPRFA